MHISVCCLAYETVHAIQLDVQVSPVSSQAFTDCNVLQPGRKNLRTVIFIVRVAMTLYFLDSLSFRIT